MQLELYLNIRDPTNSTKINTKRRGGKKEAFAQPYSLQSAIAEAIKGVF